MPTEIYTPLAEDGQQPPVSGGANFSTTLNGSGNGVSSSRQTVTYYDPATESSSNTSISNLASGSKWGVGVGTAASLTYSFAIAESVYNYSDTASVASSPLVAAQMTGAVNAMNAWAAVSNLNFVQTTDSATNAGDIRWGNTTGNIGTAYAYFASSSAAGSDIWFGSSYAAYKNPVVGDFSYYTFLHELGHALAFEHPHDSDIAPKAGEDQIKYTVMSYRGYDGQSLFAGLSNSFFPTTPMLNDVAAMQFVYGANMTYHTGADVYFWAPNQRIFETIWDAGGTDTISAANQVQGCTLYLTAGKWSQIGVAFYNGQSTVRDCLTIAYGAVIENAIGSAFNDTLEGNAVANILDGGAGADLLSGLSGDDLLDGGAGIDTLLGGTGDDSLGGGAGNDVIDGGANGASGDVVYFSGAATGVNVSLASGIAADGQGGTDTLLDIENILGSNFNDTLIGNAVSNRIEGGGGNDTIDGGAGADTANYASTITDYLFSVSAGVIQIQDINLSNGNEGTDSVTNIETLRFGALDLAIISGLRYTASYGDLIGAFHTNTDAALQHYLNSGFSEGRTASFDADVYLSKYADLRAALGSNQNAATNHYINNGFAEGRNAGLISNDLLSGTVGNDTIRGYGGNDTINGGAGIDRAAYAGNHADYQFQYSAGAITIQDVVTGNGDDGTDILTNVEVLQFANGDLTVVNGLNYIASYGDLIGAFHANADAGVTHYLRSGYAEGRTASFDAAVYLNLYADLRAVFGNDLTAAATHYINAGFAEGRIVSLTGNNILTGSSGDDTIQGFAGNDTIDGGAGNDTVSYSGNYADYSFSSLAGVLAVQDVNLANGNEGTDRLTNVEVLHFANRDVALVDGLRYIASYADLIGVFHANADAALEHYLRSGVNEGRTATFDANIYLSKYSDLRAAFGTNGNAATAHYINGGFAEGRSISLSGNDSLLGSSAGDTLDGGVGNDTLTGAGGADLFKFTAGSGVDTILDFSKVQGDRIALVSNLNGSGVIDGVTALSHVSNNGSGHAVIDLGAGNLVTLTGVASGLLTAADFVFV